MHSMTVLQVIQVLTASADYIAVLSCWDYDGHYHSVTKSNDRLFQPVLYLAYKARFPTKTDLIRRLTLTRTKKMGKYV